MLELYHNDLSSCAQKVRIVLMEKNLDWVSHHLDLRAGDQFDPEYLKLNPNGVVPTLVHDGKPVIESNVIIDYLDEKFPDPVLRPKSDEDRAAMQGWFDRLDANVHSMVGLLCMATVFRHDFLKLGQQAIDKTIHETPDERMREGKRALIEQGIDAPIFAIAPPVLRDFLADLDSALEVTPWLAGRDYSIADVAVTPYMARFDMLNLDPMWSDCAALSDWFDRIRARPTYQTVMIDDVDPQKIADLGKYGSQAWPRIEAILAAAA